MADDGKHNAMHAGTLIGWGMICGFSLLFYVGMKRMLAKEKAHSRSPFSEKLKRPAGESLRLEIEKIREEIGDSTLKLFLVAMLPAVLLIVISSQPSQFSWVFCGALVILTAGAVAWQWRLLAKLRRQLRNAHLGYDGERYVGDELHGLIARGYRVFHDFQVDWFPGERVFNIDHVAVGPEGVFAIETKTRRKRNGEALSSQPQHKVIYDGVSLKYPDWESDEQLRQAVRGAEVLSRWLTGTAKVSIDVTPVLAIPGWWVERKGKGRVKVFNGKELAKGLPANGIFKVLTPDEIQRLGDRIEAHCRNVEGK